MRTILLTAIWLEGAYRAFGQTDIYKPYRFADRWTADTLYVGASFRYTGAGPLEVSLSWSETSIAGNLFVVSPATGDTVFALSNRAPIGTTVNLSALAPFKTGDEIVFLYLPVGSKTPRYTGPSFPGSPYYNTISSDANPNPDLRFGHRFEVAGRTPSGKIEFGMEDSYGVFSDMDFNDIHYFLANAELLLYQNSAKRRAYVW
jgi:hypothetical protein